jgi:hypothetical protein
VGAIAAEGLAVETLLQEWPVRDHRATMGFDEWSALVGR